MVSSRDRKVRKKKQRKERLRRAKHEKRSNTAVELEGPRSIEIRPPGFEMERVLRQMGRTVRSGTLASREDLQRRLDGVDIDQVLMDGDPETNAQELAYRAMETRDTVAAAELCEEALRLDPDCVDAIALRTALKARSVEERVQGYSEAVAAGERSLGKEAFEEGRGHFWGVIETRPYMRARHSLAACMWSLGRSHEAIEHLADMLTLNPNDNQGLRYILVGWYLEEFRTNDARKLLAAYNGDGFAGFSWARVLERFLSGDEDEARDALGTAREEAAQVEPYLLGEKRLPSALPEHWSPGDENEAMLGADMLLDAWARNSPALLWLRQQP